MNESKTLPKWDDPNLKAGTRIRSALWLLTEVGEGNTFTKEQHRAAFPGVAQADRRLRDLRDWGWVIHNNSQDVSLNPDEQRFVAAGEPVWDRGLKKPTTDATLTSKQREAVFAENNYQCAVCGILGGESYPDVPYMSAVLSISRRSITNGKGQTETMFVTECKRCRSGKGAEHSDLPLFLEKVGRLNPNDQATFKQWARNGRQGVLEQLWSEFSRIPAAAKKFIRDQLS
jgi:hypothetical protein